jgi:ACT domain-containing protein
MKKGILLLVICLVFGKNLFAQYEVQGKVSSAEESALEFANVVLMSLPDSTMMQVETTDQQGFFTIRTDQRGEYALKVMLLGYRDYLSESFRLDDAQAKKKVDCSLTPEAQMLQTVEVKAKVPLLEQRSDRLVVNVEKSLTTLNGNLMDVLRKVPGMLIINDQISLAGQSSITILINGRTTKYMDVNAFLKEMPADNIEKIEVIHQPGAEFEASGTGPVINIVLKQNKLYGTNGSVRLGVGKASFWRYNGSLSLNHRQGNINLYGSAGYSHNTWQEWLDLDRYIEGDVYSQSTAQPSKPHTKRGNIGLDWYLHDQHTIGFSANGLHSVNDRTNVNTTNIFYGDQRPTTTLLTNNFFDREWWYVSSNAYYSYKIDTLGQKLDLDANFTTFERDNSNLIQTQNLSNDGLNFEDQRNAQPGTTDIYAIQLDYTKPFSKDISIQAGARWSSASLDNNLISELFSGGEWLNVPQQSNHFLFDEEIAAVYGKLNVKRGDWEFTGGLRFEDSRSEGYSITLDSTTRRDISQLFPSASISKALTEQLGVALAYSYRIERPSYSDLNPFLYNLDPLTFEKGNPMLRPELTHSLKMSLTYEKQPFFNLEYNRTNNPMALVTEQDLETRAAFATTVNLDRFERWGGSLFFPLDFVKGLSGYGGVMGYYNKFTSDLEGSLYENDQWSVTGFLQASFKLPLDIKAEVNGWITSGGQDGIINYESLYGLNVGFEKELLNEKASIRMSIGDLLFKYWYGDIDYGGVLADISSRWDTRVVNVQFTYRFGNQHIKKRQDRSNSASDEIDRAQGN